MTTKLIAIGVLITFLFYSCASTQQSTKSNSDTVSDGYSTISADNSLIAGNEVKPNEDRKSNWTLADMIRGLAGVEVSGNNNNIEVKVQGAQSIFGGSNPLYVLNRTQVGTEFSSLVSLVDPNDIKSIRVLKGADAAIYGTRGANGVIIITTYK